MELNNYKNIIEIDEEVDCEYEIVEILKKYPKDTVLFTNVKNHKIPVISGICNTREKIAKSINCKKEEILQKIIEATENPKKIENYEDLEDYETYDADLTKLPILKHYAKDGGKYITAGVVFARDPETGAQNASIHRMLVKDNATLGIRLVPRNLYTYFHKAEELGENLDITICIGMDPAILLASTCSIPIDADEMEVANAFKNGQLKLQNCEESDIKVPEADIILEGKIIAGERSSEGPFVDLTDTYDVVRDEPVIKLSKMHLKRNSYYHGIIPAGFEHKLLQGLPQEPRIFEHVKNTVPTVLNVALTEGGCCWLHAVVQIVKQTQGDGKNVLMAALSAHPSLKHCVVVDEDIDLFDAEDVEYAIATRVKGDEDLMVVSGARGSSLDPKALPDGTTCKIGVDATKDLKRVEKFDRVSFTEF
ncbi:UbiD family decarboxylase [uncultured Methanobrevibacter sp.]|uniref:UbiD family decarboxylase n=1 Tax=uncultured Methanobrevibacter sp. TaxID=253161 RepID=UPI0025E22490|nr:UbiD family decarboxylase [uncultured Methanobrevibacter sp.]